MRIVGGRHRGRKLLAPQDERIRPTSDRAREALFNILAHGRLATDGRSAIADKDVLDAFCGTGAVGLEAVSRGARSALLVDRDPASVALAEANIRALGEQERVQARRLDATKPGRAPASFDVAFLDPPYGEGLAAASLVALAAGGWFSPLALIVVETQANEYVAIPAGFAALDTRRYGRAKLTFLRAP